VAAGETRGSVSDFAAIERWRAVGATVWRRSVRHGKGFGSLGGRWQLGIEQIGQSTDRLDFNVTRCQYAEFYKELGLISVSLAVASQPPRSNGGFAALHMSARGTKRQFSATQ